MKPNGKDKNDDAIVDVIAAMLASVLVVAPLATGVGLIFLTVAQAFGVGLIAFVVTMIVGLCEMVYRWNKQDKETH